MQALREVWTAVAAVWDQLQVRRPPRGGGHENEIVGRNHVVAGVGGMSWLPCTISCRYARA